MLAAGKTEATITLGPKQMWLTTELDQSDFVTFQTFEVNGVEIALGLKGRAE